MPLGVTGLLWDEAAQTMTLTKTDGTSVTFSVSDIPQNVQRTVSALQTWCDNNLQTFLANKFGFDKFIKVKVQQVTPTMKFDFVVADTQAALDSYTWPAPL